MKVIAIFNHGSFQCLMNREAKIWTKLERVGNAANISACRVPTLMFHWQTQQKKMVQIIIFLSQYERLKLFDCLEKQINQLNEIRYLILVIFIFRFYFISRVFNFINFGVLINYYVLLGLNSCIKEIHHLM